MTIEAMKLALEALEALELAQDNLRSHGDNCFLHEEGEYNRCFCGKDSLSGFLQEQVESLSQAIEQAEKQEPVAWATMLGSYSHVSWGKDRPDYPIRYEVPLYTTPQPQREWVGLTQAERHDIREWQKIQEELGPVWSPMMLYLYEAIEAKLKEKNTQQRTEQNFCPRCGKRTPDLITIHTCTPPKENT